MCSKEIWPYVIFIVKDICVVRLYINRDYIFELRNKVVLLNLRRVGFERSGSNVMAIKLGWTKTS